MEHKTTRDMETNTEPLNIEIYFDNDGRVKWRIKNPIINVESRKLLELSEDSNNLDEIEHQHMVNKYFGNMFLIGCKEMYGFSTYHLILKYEHIDILHTTYDNFDYINYIENNGLHMSRDKAWLSYLDNTNNYIVNYTNEYARINGIIEAVNMAISNSYENCFITFDDNMPKMSEIQNVINNFNEEYYYTIIGYKNDADPNQLRIIKSVIINRTFYDAFLDHLKESIKPWRMAILSFAEKNYFNTNIIKC